MVIVLLPWLEEPVLETVKVEPREITEIPGDGLEIESDDEGTDYGYLDDGDEPDNKFEDTIRE